MIYLSHPTGNQNSRQAAQALSESGELWRFATALHLNSRSPLAHVMPDALRAELGRRDFTDVVDDQRMVSVARLREATRLLAQRLGISSLVRRETGLASVDAVYRACDAAVASKVARVGPVDTVYAYEDGALETFKAARERDLARIYELPIGYWRAHRRLCEEEARMHPKWAHTWHADADSEAKVRRKDEEIALASRIIVPSQFVAETLREYPGELPPVSIVPYGCPTPIDADTRRWYSGGPLRVLFVGGLSQRKGLSYLLDAVQALGDAVSLTIIGSGPGSDILRGLPHQMLGSVAHEVVLQQMREHDVFVFPSLFEGFGMVITEAMAQGLPVIITPACGPADMIMDGEQGWIVPIRDSEAITNLLERCLDAPEIVQRMGKSALTLAAERSWGHFRQELLAAVSPKQMSNRL